MQTIVRENQPRIQKNGNEVLARNIKTIDVHMLKIGQKEQLSRLEPNGNQVLARSMKEVERSLQQASAMVSPPRIILAGVSWL